MAKIKASDIKVAIDILKEHDTDSVRRVLILLNNELRQRERETQIKEIMQKTGLCRAKVIKIIDKENTEIAKKFNLLS